MIILYKAIALENYIVNGDLIAKKDDSISANYATKEELLNRMKERASYTAGIPFRVEEVYIVEEGDRAEDKK